jgi:peptidoglycan LD-endopeptidase LytH
MSFPFERFHPARRGGDDRASAPARRSVIAALCVAVGLLVAVAVPAAADPATDAFERDIERLESEQRRVRAEADRLEAEQAQVEREQERLAGELQAATQRLGELEAQYAALTERAAQNAQEVRRLVDERSARRARLGARARALYQLGGLDPTLMLLSGASTEQMIETAHYVAAVSNRDQEAVEGYRATTTRLDRRQADLGVDRRKVADLQREVEQARAELNARLEEAAAAQERLVELREQAAANLAKLEQEEGDRRAREKARLAEIERKRREEQRRRAAEERARRKAAAAEREASRSRGSTDPVPAVGGMACPQAQPRSFMNDWGFPRSGGRRHKGTDVFGRMGGPVYAITSGTVEFTKVGRTAGLFLGLRGDDGHVYWYMHLSAFEARSGQRVTPGQLIGRNGDTGNAKGTPPHVHFEYHPGGGGPTNPYPLLRAVCS